MKEKLNQAEITQFFRKEFPHHDKISIESVGSQSATLRHQISSRELRPGNTVAGPTIMLLADVTIYVAILGEIGLVPLAVTTSLNINFLRKPAANADLVARCKLIKIGKQLIIGEVNIYSEGQAEPVAHCVATYAVPPSR